MALLFNVEDSRTGRWLAAAWITACAASFTLAAGPSPAVELSAQTGAQYDGWSGAGSDAHQFHVPMRFWGRSGDFSASLLTAYAYTTRNPSEGSDASLGTLIDTKLNTSYEIVGKLPVDLLIGLDFNLPTGKTDLNRKEATLVMDPELLPINNFGEGFNVNPTVTVARSWGSVAAGLGFGYLWRDSYDYSSDLRLEDYDPGDVASVTGEARWLFAPEWEARLVGSYSHFGKDRIDGEDVFREGDFWSFLLGLQWMRDRWGAAATLQGIFRGKGELPSAQGRGLETEAHRLRGDEWRAALSCQYRLDDKTSLTGALRALWVAENGYSEDSSSFIGEREKLGLTLGVLRKLSPTVEGGLDLGGFYLHDAKLNFPEPRGGRSYRGASLAVKVAAAF